MSAVVLSQVLRLKPGLLRHAREHCGADFGIIVKRESVVRPTGPG